MSSSELKTSGSACSATCKAPVDYYAVLGIQKDASKTAIKKAYGQLAWKWHPLKNLAYQLEAKAMFKKIAEAYAILSHGEMRREYDANLADGKCFRAHLLEFADPRDIFDDFKSFRGLKFGDDHGDVDVSSASEDEEAMSIGSGNEYSRAEDKIVSVEYSVASRVGEDTDKVKTDSTVSTIGSDLAAGQSSIVSQDVGENVATNAGNDGDGGALSTKTVHLSTETKPDGRTYMTKKLLENGVETLNVVREGDITDTDISDAEKFVDW